MRRGSVSTAHWHYGPLVHAEWCGDGGIFNVVGVYARLEEGVGHVENGEYFAFGAVAEDVGYAWQGMVVGHGVLIQLAIIVDPSWKDVRISLGDDERGRTEFARGRTDSTSTEVLIDEFAPGVLPFTGTGVLATFYGLGWVLELKSVEDIVWERVDVRQFSREPILKLGSNFRRKSLKGLGASEFRDTRTDGSQDADGGIGTVIFIELIADAIGDVDEFVHDIPAFLLLFRDRGNGLRFRAKNVGFRRADR